MRNLPILLAHMGREQTIVDTVAKFTEACHNLFGKPLFIEHLGCQLVGADYAS